MRILCICQHGNIRSVALAYLIKTIYKHEAIAVGIKEMSEDTLDILSNWADKIIVLTKTKLMTSDAKLAEKIVSLYVGEDVWHDPFAQELQHKLLKKLKGLDL